MTKDGRLIETDKVAMGVWKRLTSEFATWKMLILAGMSSRTWAQYSNDHLTPMLKASHWKIGLGLLGGLTDKQVAFLREFARLNAERVDRQFRTTATVLVTVPVGLLLAVNEVAPGLWERLGVERAEGFFLVLLVWFFITAIMMAVAWRARDLSHLLDFEHARRQLDPDPEEDGES